MIRRQPVLIWLLAVTLIAIELGLWGADLGLWGGSRWRTLAYQNGAFWPGLLSNWQPNYPVQPATMFLTYAFLHGGIGHLLGNVITLFSIGPMVIEQAGRRAFVEIFAAAALGGALIFTWLNSAPQPMVGASGAIFGLAGALTVWFWKDGGGWRATLGIVALLSLLNLAIWWFLKGQLAWESHLGGFLAGAATGAAMPRKPPQPST